MKKIEIDDIQELIKKGYPVEKLKKLLDNVLMLSLQVKDDYPDYKNWFMTKQLPGIYDNTRNIIIAHIDENIVGFASLKKTKEEKKICTFYVEKSFRKNRIGSLLVTKAIEYLEEEKPLITIPMDKLNEFIKISNKYGWKITDIQENLYRTTVPEVIVNGVVLETEKSIMKEPSLQKTYKIYKMECIRKTIKLLLTLNKI